MPDRLPTAFGEFQAFPGKNVAGGFGREGGFPIGNLLEESLDHGRLLLGEIIFLERISGEIVQFGVTGIAVGHKLPVLVNNSVRNPVVRSGLLDSPAGLHLPK